jgi:hypothetical protein
MKHLLILFNAGLNMLLGIIIAIDAAVREVAARAAGLAIPFLMAYSGSAIHSSAFGGGSPSRAYRPIGRVWRHGCAEEEEEKRLSDELREEIRSLAALLDRTYPRIGRHFV